VTSENKFWVSEVAQEISRAYSKFTVATGITPSGEIHIGNMREIVTADVAVRALKELGKDVAFFYIADTYDPLRRVYPFLSKEKYEEHVGRPLSEIPCPCDQHPSYAQHYLEPFLKSLKTLDIKVEVFQADHLYKEGKYTRNIIKSLEATQRIREILKEETGKETEPTWSPFNPICNACHRMTHTEVLGFDSKNEQIQYKCGCGDEGLASMAGGGKLTWRVDWPARWEILGVTIEPFGKDHASKGGSYDTGVRFSREIFKYEPPFPIVYEWISLRGAGDMSSSKGNVISIQEMLDVVPPEVLKYAVLKVRPNRRIVFDPCLPLLSLMDEFDDPSSKGRNESAIHFSQITGSSPLGIPFRHMVSLVQTARGNAEEIKRILDGTGYKNLNEKAVFQRAQYAKKWLDRFGPEDLKFEVQEIVPKAVKTLTDLQRKALALLAFHLSQGMTPEVIHGLIYKVKDELNISPQELFEAIYKALLGKEKGPRAGFFLASLDPTFVKKRFEEASTPVGS